MTLVHLKLMTSLDNQEALRVLIMSTLKSFGRTKQLFIGLKRITEGQTVLALTTLV
jgi:hypothetical protein